jgi:glycosyltransferase involved in cell wall biosynthesis
MPVLNPHPVYFRLAVRSLLTQTFRDWELLIVEDPSEQSAQALLADVDDARLRHIAHERRTNFVTQLNRGLAEARGDWVARLDADDIAAPERLQMQVEFLQAHPEIAVVGSQIRIIDAAGQPLGYRAYPLEHERIVASFRRFNALAHPSVLFRKELVLKVGGYQRPEYHPAEDYELWSRMAVHGLRFANLPEALLDYRVHDQATKITRLRATLQHTLSVKELYWRRSMNGGDQLRFWGERLLMLLPAKVILRLFTWHEYRPTLAPQPVTDRP